MRKQLLATQPAGKAAMEGVGQRLVEAIGACARSLSDMERLASDATPAVASVRPPPRSLGSEGMLRGAMVTLPPDVVAISLFFCPLWRCPVSLEMVCGLRGFALHAGEIVTLSCDSLVDPVVDLQPSLFMYMRSAGAATAAGRTADAPAGGAATVSAGTATAPASATATIPAGGAAIAPDTNIASATAPLSYGAAPLAPGVQNTDGNRSAIATLGAEATIAVSLDLSDTLLAEKSPVFAQPSTTRNALTMPVSEDAGVTAAATERALPGLSLAKEDNPPRADGATKLACGAEGSSPHAEAACLVHLPGTASEEVAYGKELARFLAELLNMLPCARKRETRKIIISPHGGLNNFRFGALRVFLVSENNELKFGVSFLGGALSSGHVNIVESLLDCGKALAASEPIPVTSSDRLASVVPVSPRASSLFTAEARSERPDLSKVVSPLLSSPKNSPTTGTGLQSMEFKTESCVPPGPADPVVVPQPSPITPMSTSVALSTANASGSDITKPADVGTGDGGEPVKSPIKKRPRPEADDDQVQAALSDAARLLKCSARDLERNAASPEVSPKASAHADPVHAPQHVSETVVEAAVPPTVPGADVSATASPVAPLTCPDLRPCSAGLGEGTPSPPPVPPPGARTTLSSAGNGPRGGIDLKEEAHATPGCAIFGAAGLVGRSKLLLQAAAKRRVVQDIKSGGAGARDANSSAAEKDVVSRDASACDAKCSAAEKDVEWAVNSGTKTCRLNSLQGTKDDKHE